MTRLGAERDGVTGTAHLAPKPGGESSAGVSASVAPASNFLKHIFLASERPGVDAEFHERLEKGELLQAALRRPLSLPSQASSVQR